VKKSILSFALAAFLAAGCSSNNGNQEAAHENGADTHEHGADSHEHGSEAAHDESQPHEHAEDAAAPQQEEFTVEQDSAQGKPATKPHQHEGGKPHTH
jgi:hypothetical protein